VLARRKGLPDQGVFGVTVTAAGAGAGAKALGGGSGSVRIADGCVKPSAARIAGKAASAIAA
jgi:hypothetical protein